MDCNVCCSHNNIREDCTNSAGNMYEIPKGRPGPHKRGVANDIYLGGYEKKMNFTFKLIAYCLINIYMCKYVMYQ